MQILTIRNDFKFKFEPFKPNSKHSNANSIHLKGIRRIRMQIWTLRKRFQGILPFEFFESHSKGSFFIRMLRIWFEWFEFAFKSFQMARICIQNPFKWLEFAFERFKSRSNSWNLQSNGENPFEYKVECLESRSKGSNLLRISFK